MKSVNFANESDFPYLIPLVKKFSERTDVPYYQQLHELTLSFLNSTYLTIVGKNDEKESREEGTLVGYLVGFYYNPTDFLVTQIYSEDPQITSFMINFIECHLQSQGLSKIFGLVKPNPTVFERHGYKVERYIMSKSLKGGD